MKYEVIFGLVYIVCTFVSHEKSAGQVAKLITSVGLV